MKYFILFFMVTWNQYDLVWTNNPGNLSLYVPPNARTYEVKLIEHHQRLETQRDVDLFIGYDEPARFSNDFYPPLMNHIQGIISPTARDIKVQEIKQ